MKKGSLGIVSFKVQGESISPTLTIDKKQRTDGEYHMNFKYWSFRGGDSEVPSSIQKLTYTNNTKADLLFNLETTGPFEILKTKSSTNA